VRLPAMCARFSTRCMTTDISRNATIDSELMEIRRTSVHFD
jgi:hypothetical protein